MKNPNQLIILGGGTSIQEGISRGLWDKLKGHFVIGTNFSYKFYEATCQTYVDSTFYNKNYPDIKKLPLIIGQGKSLSKKADNTLSLKCTSIYNRDLSEGVYSACLVGIYSLSLGIYLLDEGEIFLLGYDFGSVNTVTDEKQRRITHFYQGQIDHRGIGKTNWYDTKNRAEKDFGIFKNENKIKIYNVSPSSKIEVFKKIDYTTFFSLLNNNQYDQSELRTYIKEKLHDKL